MGKRVGYSIKQVLIIYIAAAVVLIPAAQGWAMFLPTHEIASPTLGARATTSSGDLDWTKVQAILESKVIRQRLLDLGLTAEETASRLSQLSEAERHQIASQIDSLYAGGDGLGTVAALLVIAVLVVVLLHLTGHRVIITK